MGYFDPPPTTQEALYSAELAIGIGMLEVPVVLSGTVLVGHLFEMCEKRGINVDRRTTPERTLNNALLDHKVYNEMQFEQIQLWLEMREAAVRFEEVFNHQQVESMLKGIRDFINTYK